MPLPVNVQTIPTGRLMQEYREIMLSLGKDTTDATLSRQADLFEEEILRRMAW